MHIQLAFSQYSLTVSSTDDNQVMFPLECIKKTPTSIWPAVNSVSVVMREVIATLKLSRSSTLRGCSRQKLAHRAVPWGPSHSQSQRALTFTERKGKKMANGVYSACRAFKNIGEKRENSPSIFSLTPMWCCLFLKISPQSKERGAKHLHKL